MISQVYGGGRSRIIQLIVKSDQGQILKAMGISIKNDLTSEPVELVYEGENTLLLKPEPQKLRDELHVGIQVEKSSIAGIAYMKSRN